MQWLNGRSPVIICCYCSSVCFESLLEPLSECFFCEFTLRMISLIYDDAQHKKETVTEQPQLFSIFILKYHETILAFY